MGTDLFTALGEPWPGRLEGEFPGYRGLPRLRKLWCPG